MFNFFEPDAEASTVLPDSSLPEAGLRPDRIRHLIVGSLEAIRITIKAQHKQGYAEPNDWSDPLPTGRPKEWFSIVTKRVWVE
ncbi:MAG: hypothetical protein HC886_23095 [Leptolyngbyaceae cyanobacterium SM1_1_3]|nr:hypothetical protein [Leptolyngbyaceae cyanobacterium SM1_1_3]NJN02129.1 hypothetical protein [Leptolyngbyaceae cyanobacterium RM1_1_2]NJO08986.1 hypothetical protein [Leptolyngbyaceae cyanobacterium SL_1_1]